MPFVLYESAECPAAALPARLAAAAAGVQLKVEKVKDAEAAGDVLYRLNAHPLGKLPALLTEDGYLWGELPLARFLAGRGDSGVRGRTQHLLAEVDQWMDLAQNELHPAARVWADTAGDAAFRGQGVQRVCNVFCALNVWLEIRTFLVDDRLTLADIAIFCALLPLLRGSMCDEQWIRGSYPHLLRWLRTCIHQKPFVAVFDGVLELPRQAAKGQGAADLLKGGPAAAAAGAAPAKAAQPKGGDKAAKDKGTDKQKGGEKKKQQPAAPAAANDGSALDIRVGKILEAKKHPDADSLYVEQIDLGEGAPRTICSGLVKFMPAEALAGRMCLVMANLKPVKMRGIASNGMVMCSETNDGSACDLLAPPAGAQPGDRITLRKYEQPQPPGGDVKPLIKDKDKLAALLADLKTDSKGVPHWKDAPWEVDGKGTATSKHLNAKVK
eukprot:TRINITY_DN24771_c0_g1_i1.p1 TRINITY_DN24771_c0_g1~~TRINITY_DN24771_c0_g1_i1.p1  ORF type:complete len:476 (+),score=174.05 TRINITY_DN24771_c0_g1_i1:110-1429(+)